ncbi:MAG: hypothetical protein LBR88_00620 [Zoogloeaceae bacterium]|jgi:hypothetical protein|nr:hypothetical protein [Zoogloeaceae bacterium]
MFTATIYLLPPKTGEHFKPLPRSEWHTVLTINNENWSARLLFSGKPLPGDTFQATVQLLVPEAIHYFPVDAKFTVGERETKAIGRVLDYISPPPVYLFGSE